MARSAPRARKVLLRGGLSQGMLPHPALEAAFLFQVCYHWASRSGLLLGCVPPRQAPAPVRQGGDGSGEFFPASL